MNVEMSRSPLPHPLCTPLPCAGLGVGLGVGVLLIALCLGAVLVVLVCQVALVRDDDDLEGVVGGEAASRLRWVGEARQPPAAVLEVPGREEGWEEVEVGLASRLGPAPAPTPAP